MPEEIRYKEHYLTDVIARVDFAGPVDKILTNLPKKLTEGALRFFPIAEPQKLIAQELQVSQSEVSAHKSEFTDWRFLGREREKTLTISHKAFFVNYNRYNSFDNLKEEFLTPLRILFDEFPEIVSNRFGLRYINNISIEAGDPMEWEEFLNASLLCTLKFHDNKKEIARAFNILELNFDNYSLRYQYGMYNPDFPAAIKKKMFVLDLDTYQNGLLNYDDITQSIDTFHNRIQKIFEVSIRDKLREQMNG